jgi:arylsulfatase A-like enzyme
LSATIDILPTIAALCKVPLSNNKIDGTDISALIKGDMAAEPRQYFYYYYRRNALEAVRKGDWKLVLEHPGRTYEGFAPGKDGVPGGANENFAHKLALYDLRRDVGERYDVKDFYPDIVAELQTLAETARADLGDDLTQRTGSNVRPSGMIK